MKLQPLDIKRQQFARGFRGYDPAEVDAFLKQVADQQEDLGNEVRQSEDRVRELEGKLKHYERVELALQEALETARETGRRAEAAAAESARLVTERAELRAQEILQDAERDRYGIRQDILKLTTRQAEVGARLRGFLLSELEILAQFQGDDPVGFLKLEPAGAGRSMPQAALPAADPAPTPGDAPEDETPQEETPTDEPQAPEDAARVWAAPAKGPAEALSPEADETPDAGSEAPDADAPEATADDAGSFATPAPPWPPREEDEDGAAESDVEPAAPEEATASAQDAEAATPDATQPALDPLVYEAPQLPPTPWSRTDPAAPSPPADAAPEASEPARPWETAAPDAAADAPPEASEPEPMLDWSNPSAPEWAADAGTDPAPPSAETPADETPTEPLTETPASDAPAAPAGGGWNFRSLVTGPEDNVAGSEAERERIRRILDDLD